jgi:hypothetical protein
MSSERLCFYILNFIFGFLLGDFWTKSGHSPEYSATGLVVSVVILAAMSGHIDGALRRSR